MSKSFPLKIESADVAMAANKALIGDIMHRLPKLDQRRMRGLFDHPVSVTRRLLHLAGPLPASESHHDCGPYGLFIHTLNAVRESINAFHEIHGSDGPDYQQKITAAILGAFLHDIGKLFYITATSQEGEEWKVIHGYLVRDGVGEAAFDGTFTPGTVITARFKYGRARSGHRGHEPLSWWIHHFLTMPSMTGWLGLEQSNNVAAISCMSMKGVIDQLGEIVARGDHLAAELGTTIRRTASPQFTFGSGSRAEDFIAIMRALADQGKLTFNDPKGNVYLSKSHTILPLLVKPKGSPDVLRLALEYGKGQSHSSPSVSTWYQSAAADFYHELRTKCIQLMGDESWMLPAGDVSEKNKPDFKHQWVTIATVGRKAQSIRNSTVIIFRNSHLWGSKDMAAAHGVWDQPMRFLDDSGKSITIAPEDIGFKSLDPVADRLTTPPGKQADPSGDEPFNTLVDLATKLWVTVDRFAPIEGVTHIHQTLRNTDDQVRGKTIKTTNAAYAVLANLLDRLRDHAAAVEAGDRPRVAAHVPAEPAPPASSAAPQDQASTGDEDVDPIRDPDDPPDDDPEADEPVDPAEKEDHDDRTAITTTMFSVILAIPQMVRQDVPDPMIIRSGTLVAIRWPEVPLAIVNRTRPGVTAKQVETMTLQLMKLEAVRSHLGIISGRLDDPMTTVVFPTGKARGIVADISKMRVTASKPAASPIGLFWSDIGQVQFS